MLRRVNAVLPTIYTYECKVNDLRWRAFCNKNDPRSRAFWNLRLRAFCNLTYECSEIKYDLRLRAFWNSDYLRISARYNPLSTLMIEIYKRDMTVKVKVKNMHEMHIWNVNDNWLYEKNMHEMRIWKVNDM